ncbi:uncharacterized protein LOC117343810 [Pecten maximus]|uniref:uncharacterized protein LOC117343810 n=1 Tax=Pecten maximus TaxID=6579 RepID=UPI0014582485|nr:uncharacterized protein LOC117343810 [Pecten maximus]
MLTAIDYRISQLEIKLDTEMKKKNSEILQLRQDMGTLKQTTDMYKSEFKERNVEKVEYNVNKKSKAELARPERYEVITILKEVNITEEENGNNNKYKGQKSMDDDDRVNNRNKYTRQIRSRHKRVVSTPPIAFHTKMSSSKTMLTGNTLIYDEETLDQGNGYNPRDGIYTVPVSGTYVFAWKVLSKTHTIIITSLVVNGEVMGSSDSDSEDITDYHQSTAMVVVPLIQGDHVFIRITRINSNGGLVSDNGHGKATFLGWKL